MLGGCLSRPRANDSTSKEVPGPRIQRDPRVYRGTQRDPEVVVWPSVFLEAWGTKAPENLAFSRKSCFVCLAASASRPKNHDFSQHVWCFEFGTPGNQLANKILRDPSEDPRVYRGTSSPVHNFCKACPLGTDAASLQFPRRI